MTAAKFYKDTIKELKSAILQSRYKAATLANKEMLLLYFSVGALISAKTKTEAWGAKVLDNIAKDLQKELPGLRGFSATNLKRMKSFYESWEGTFSISSPAINTSKKTKRLIGPTLSGELQLITKNISNKPVGKGISKENILISPTLSDQLQTAFLSISFSHHAEIISKSKSTEELQFYTLKSAIEFWSLSTLENKIRSNYFKKQGKLPNNFSKAISDNIQREKALSAFKDEYLLDFINIEDADNSDERELETEIIRNIRKFILSIGTDFAFIGNQYRLAIEDEEYFVDLLFFNRKLQCLVAFELKKGKFKPEYLGKMNFYLSALDDMVKQSHENASIGIILCKSRTDKVVEYAFRDFNKAMGVATYKTSKALPQKYKGILPDANQLKQLL